jgi:hypothetical protein
MEPDATRVPSATGGNVRKSIIRKAISAGAKKNEELKACAQERRYLRKLVFNLRANRWANFETEELKELDRFIENSRVYDTHTNVEDEIDQELARRRAGGAA